MNTTGSLISALSPSVRRLICYIGSSSACVDEHDEQTENEGDRTVVCFFNADGTLKLDVLASMLPAEEKTAEYFEKATLQLAPVFLKCKQNITSINEDHISILLTQLGWMHCHKILVDSFQFLRTQEEHCPKNILVLLLFSAALERALGNVFMLKGEQCPSMLKDLLLTDELAEILGPSLIKVLHVVIGPPVSLNLRNVAWHGFLGDSELSSRYCCFLVLLAASIGNILSRKGISDVPPRLYVSWGPSVKSKLLAPPLNAGIAETKENMQSLHKYLEMGKVIQPSSQQQWQLVFSLYEEGRYGLCLTLLLPLLEHCLRRVFATVNECPERIMTAESSALYTTFTEMLDQTLSDGTTNKLPDLLSAPCMDLLQDLLFYPQGPRVRDHVSHGEVDLEQVDQSMVYTFVCVAAHMASSFIPDDAAEVNYFVKDMIEKVKSYRSQFHPVAILQQKFLELLQLVDKMDSSIIVSLDLQEL